MLMSAVVPGAIAVLFYAASAFRQSQTLMGHRPSARAMVLILGLVAVLNHAFSVGALILVPDGLHLGFLRVASLVFLVVAALALFSSVYKPLENLFVLLFPVAALVELAALAFPSVASPRTDLGGGVLAHALLSIVAYSLLIIAVCQAVLLAFQDHALKSRNIGGIVRVLPPLETMEGLLFQMLWTGFLFLTLSIASGFVFLEDMLGQKVAHKTLFSLLSWIVFAVLLAGRHRLGWRGEKAIRWTVGGGILLLLGYFGSKVVLELVLQRV